jgi:hypothetical protein
VEIEGDGGVNEEARDPWTEPLALRFLFCCRLDLETIVGLPIQRLSSAEYLESMSP